MDGLGDKNGTRKISSLDMHRTMQWPWRLDSVICPILGCGVGKPQHQAPSCPGPASWGWVGVEAWVPVAGESAVSLWLEVAGAGGVPMATLTLALTGYVAGVGRCLLQGAPERPCLHPGL